MDQGRHLLMVLIGIVILGFGAYCINQDSNYSHNKREECIRKGLTYYKPYKSKPICIREE